jgi:hypothetical protein
MRQATNKAVVLIIVREKTQLSNLGKYPMKKSHIDKRTVYQLY